MKYTQKDFDEVLALDEKRTQGDYLVKNMEVYVRPNTPFGKMYTPLTKDDASFITSAPKMADMIRQLLKERERADLKNFKVTDVII